ALLFLIAFLNALNQFKPLLGERGLLPVPQFVKQTPFRSSPSLFFFLPRDAAFTAVAWLGLVLSCAALAGLAERYSLWLSMLIWALLWLLYLSFVNVGQTFYSFGWESILLEACFYAIFLGNRASTPQSVVIWLFRWLLFRIMFGAGMIKLRGDPCWRDLSCLDYHYETQPMPNPLSWFFHWGPEWTRRGGVLINHFAELIVPFAYFLPQPVSSIAGLLTILFQGAIFISGNLSWLNALTMILAFSAFDDRSLSILLPGRPFQTHAPAALKIATAGLAILVAWLSAPVVRNLVSPNQVMNTVYNRFHLVGSYGAFGAITRPRYEIVVQGTDEAVLTASTQWRAYEFKGKPGDPSRRPPQIAPYHLRLDWLMWFAAMSSYRRHPWFVHFLGKLLEGDQAVLGLLRANPFPHRPPRHVRALLYQYQFTSPAEREDSGKWWKRQFLSVYFPPVSFKIGPFRDLLERQGWLAEQSH
ncbi:MAG TPA: lipase maturation factor family protein, partial [Bryobacteraceae bacterium]|nr:lipase maturation factor family protein [Bryobacteraceae bacterium]